MNIAEFGNQKIGLWQKQIMMNYLCVSMYQVPLRKDEQPQKNMQYP